MQVFANLPLLHRATMPFGQLIDCRPLARCHPVHGGILTGHMGPGSMHWTPTRLQVYFYEGVPGRVNWTSTTAVISLVN